MSLPITTNTSNTTNVLPNDDYGLKVSKAGFDALTAQDNDLLFNSSWPSLQVVKVVQSTGTTAIAHGLPYPTFAVIYGQDPILSFNTAFTPLNTDATYVYPSIGTVVIYNLDITTDVDYPYSDKPKVLSTYDSNYGIKMAKVGADINSTDLRDYIIHSRTGSPLVLAVKTETTVSPNNPTYIQYTNRLGYPAFVFGYIYNDSTARYVVAPAVGQAYPITFSNGTTSYIQTGVLGSKGSLVVLRSPMFASTPVGVTYS